VTRTVLIAGYGAFGALHAAAWSRLPGIALRVADAEAAARARAVADEIAPEAVFADLAAAMAGADIVDIVTPPDAHVDVAEMALARGLPVLIEKPATRTLAEALKLRRLAKNNPVQVGLILRAHPLTIRARALLAEGAIGRLVSMCGDFSGWKRMREDSSLLENDGVHFLDLMRHLAGSAIASVDAAGHSRLGGSLADDIRIDTTHASGITGELRLGLVRGGTVADSVVPGAQTRKELTLCGDGGIVHLDFNRNRLTKAAVRYAATPGGWHPHPGALETEETGDTSTVDLLRASFAAFLDSLDHDAPPLCGIGEGAVELARVTDAIATALDRGPRAPVKVLEPESTP
jgi:predicted dehydrogenase